MLLGHPVITGALVDWLARPRARLPPRLSLYRAFSSDKILAVELLGDSSFFVESKVVYITVQCTCNMTLYYWLVRFVLLVFEYYYAD